MRLLIRLWHWFRAPRYAYVSDEWLCEHVGGTYDDNPRSQSTRR